MYLTLFFILIFSPLVLCVICMIFKKPEINSTDCNTDNQYCCDWDEPTFSGRYLITGYYPDNHIAGNIHNDDFESS
jgi:hypothetical protein